ncbi:MAG: polysaccharide pyruvyl transferase CsaB [Synergistaceae bacterium]|nr:polysaccharide pyruvyl transferase CsaB [Synergistaceae bacterium]
MRSFDVLVAGYYGFGNLGDELLAEAVVAQLETAGTNKERIAILSANPRETSEKLGIQAFDRWNIKKIYGIMKRTKTLLLGGGGLFQDSTSVRSCLYYWGIVRMALFCGARPWAVGQSIGPLKSMTGSYLARGAFVSCVYRGVRDRSSLGMINNWGLFGTLAPDLVMCLKIKRDYAHGDVLLLNLRQGYEKISRLAAKHAANIAEEKKLKIIGIALSDADTAELEKYHESGILKLDQITVLKSIADYENILSGSCCAIGMRLHFLVLALLAGLPTRGVPYDPKVRSFCEEWDIPVFDSWGAGFSVPVDENILAGISSVASASFRQGYDVAMGDANG